MIRFDAEDIEFVAKLPISEGGYRGGTFNPHGNYYYTSATDPPTRYKIRRADEFKGFETHLDDRITDLSAQEPDNITATVDNSSAVAMSNLVTIHNTNFEGRGNSEQYVLGIDALGRLVVTKDNCTNKETWFLNTSTTSSITGGFGAAYVFDGRVYFEARDGSGVFELPLDGFNVGQGKVDLKLAGVTQDADSSDFGGWSETGFNCMKSPSPFYVGECQVGYHEVDRLEDGTCPAGAVEVQS